MDPQRFGKYVLTDLVASGGMAEVFRAVVPGPSGRFLPLAIKRILPQYSTDDEFVSLLIDEAKVMVLLNHPNIVPIIEFGKIEGSYYIAMDFVDGVTLKDVFRRVCQRDGLTVDLAAHVVREVATGLAYAHRKTDEGGVPFDIVHRDISPANILVSFEGDVRITDFGIAKAANQSHRTQAGIIRGKTGYMSPEQTKANAVVDCRSDVYSLGIIFFELLTGRRLFQAKSVPEALNLIRASHVPPIREVRSDVPQQLEAVLRKALACELEDRYARAEDLVDALNEFLTRWSPEGRPVRITDADVAGFLRRFFPKEHARFLLRRDEEAAVAGDVTVMDKPAPAAAGSDTAHGKTFASNPLHDLTAVTGNMPPAPGPESATSKTDPDETQVTGAVMPSSSPQPPPDGVAWLTGKFRSWGPWLGAGVVRFIERARERWQDVVDAFRRVLPLLRDRRVRWGAAFVSLFVVGLVWSFCTLSRRPSPEIAEPVTPEATVTAAPLVVELAVESDPAGAEIFVDGEPLGVRTPYRVELEAGRAVTVEARKEGYAGAKREIVPEADGAPIRLVLAPTGPAVIHLRTEPGGAAVRMDGRILPGTTPMDLPPVELGKTHTLTISRRGYRTETQSLRELVPGRRTRTVLLTRTAAGTAGPRPTPTRRGDPSKPAHITVGATPWCHLSVDGKPVDITPVRDFAVQAGRRRVRCTPDPKFFSHAAIEFTLDVAGGDRLLCRITFSPRDHVCQPQ